VYYPLDADVEMRSELAVPLISASGRLEGVINLESPQVNAFSEDDRLLLQSLATQALVAIQEVRLLDALQEAAQLLLDRPLPDVLNRLVELGCELLNASAGHAWLREGDQLILEARIDRARAGIVKYRVRASVAGETAVEAELMCTMRKVS
jgi:GAF domain-containing protein